MNINNKVPGAERQTRQREAVARVFARAGRPLTPAEVLGAGRKTVRGLGLATVYRTVKLLAGEGALKVVKLPGEPVRYEPTGPGHHHHFRCEDCGKVYPIRGCPGPMKGLAPRGFVVRDHTIILHGVCSVCRK